MQLTRYTDYALRMLIRMALQPDTRVTVRELAQEYQISQHHLVKVAHHLAKKGYVASSKGRKGGLQLARDAADINLGALIRDTERSLQLVTCEDEKSGVRCAIQGSCRLPDILQSAVDAMMAELDSYSLADLVCDAGSLRVSLINGPHSTR